MNKVEFAERIAKSFLDREHIHAGNVISDDAEYIPLLKRIIATISAQLLAEGCTQEECAHFTDKLYDYAKKLYFETWMIQAEEEEGENVDAKKELKMANKKFDEYYTATEDFQ